MAAEGPSQRNQSSEECEENNVEENHKDGNPTQYEGPFSNPVYKRIALINGEINRMTKEQIRQRLSELKLDTRGVKEVLKKRLKNFYKTQKLIKAKVKEPCTDPHYKYLLVIDFEATCQEHNPAGFKYEIIEFPIVLVDTEQKIVIDEFHEYVRPVINPKLSEFCVTLTGIPQSKVDNASTFPVVLDSVYQWMNKHNLPGQKFAVLTDGPWDMARFLHQQCIISQVAYPRWARKWINIRKSFSNFYGFRRSKLATMLENLGMSFQGQQHSGIDDARNIARISVRMLEDGCDLKVNERLYAHKLKDIANLTSEIHNVVCDLNPQDSSDSETEAPKKNSKSKSSVAGVTRSLDRVSLDSSSPHLSNGDAFQLAPDLSEGIDDLIAYHKLQRS